MTSTESSSLPIPIPDHFQADNVVKSVYVGDKVQVKGKVTRKNGESAYITDKGLYLTTDIQYLNDYTTEADSLENEK